jgi:hypothetical protein
MDGEVGGEGGEIGLVLMDEVGEGWWAILILFIHFK